MEKSNGKIRTCIDYTPTNKVTREWEWPLPKIQELRYHIQEGAWFSRLDLKEAFHRIPVAWEDIPLTAFHSPWGDFEFLRMPFGLCTAPATYQRFLDQVLHGLTNRWNYVDDILVWGRTRKELRAKEALVRDRLAKASIEINEEKSESEKKELTIVGLRIREGRIGCALKHKEWTPPVTKQDWQSALGFVNCFRDYLPSLSDLTAGLYPGTQQLPHNERQRKFVELMRKLSQHVGLHHFQYNQPATLFLDASNRAIGAVLTQQGKVCAIFSKALTKGQQSYSATDREHLALMQGLEKFRVLVQGNRNVSTLTDHSALLNRDTSKLTKMQMRWRLRVLEIVKSLAHTPGSSNPADYWSRQGYGGGGEEFWA